MDSPDRFELHISRPVARLLLGSLFIFILIASLTACQGLSLPNFLSSPTPKEPSAQNTPVPSPVSQVPEQASKPTQAVLSDIILWVPPQFNPENDSDAGRILKQHLNDFEDENPGVRVITRVKAASGPAGLLASLRSASSAATSAVPALVLLSRSDLESAATDGLILPIDTLTKQLEEDDWFDYARQLAMIKGRTYGLPFSGDALILVYRPARVAGPPANWESISRQGQPVIFAAGDRSSLVTIDLYLSSGGVLLNEQGMPTVQTQPLEKVLKLYFDGLLLNAFPNWLAQYQTDSQAFQAYVDFKGQWLVTWSSSFLTALPADSTATTLPALGDRKITLTSGWVWGLSDPRPDNRELSIRLAEHLVQPEFLARWTPLSASLPVRPTTMVKWNSLSIQNLINEVLDTAVIIPGNDILSQIGPVLQEATSLILKRESDPVRASQGALDRLTAPPAVQ